MSSKPTYHPDPVFTLRNTVVTMLRTQYLSFELAMDLNRAYNFHFTRLQDITVDKLPHPCFIYYDEPASLTYVIVGCPSLPEPSPVFDNYDKMLLIRGRDAKKIQQHIYDEIHNRHISAIQSNATEPDPTDHLQHTHWQHCNTLANAVRQIDTFHLDPSNKITSTLRMTATEPTLFPLDLLTDTPTESKAVTIYYKQLQTFLEELFLSFQYQLTNEDEENL